MYAENGDRGPAATTDSTAMHAGGDDPVATPDLEHIQASAGLATPVMVIAWLRGCPAQWWYPWLMGLGSSINSFAGVFSAPLVVLFLVGVGANPKARHMMAFVNAAGTAASIALLAMGMQSSSNDCIEARFAQELDSTAAAITRQYCDMYGVFGVVLISTMPIFPLFLQPLHVVFVGVVVAKIEPITLVLCVLIGQALQYAIMAELAIAAAHLLKICGGHGRQPPQELED